MKAIDLNGIDARADAGVIFDAAEIKLLTALIRELQIGSRASRPTRTTAVVGRIETSDYPTLLGG